VTTGPHRFGTVAIVGRPNAGKSTLLNALVGERVSIVTPRAQTTRNRIAGIRTLPGAQLVLLDTPGVVAGTTPLNRRLQRIAEQAAADADVLVLVVDVQTGLGRPERDLLARLPASRLVAAINKIDAVRPSAALPLLASLARLAPDVPGVPVSATEGTQLDALLGELVARLSPGPPVFAAEDYTTASTRFLAQEIVREQVFLQTRQELPYGTAVVVEGFDEAGAVTRIDASILVARDAHKGMMIGAGGARVKAIGERARPALEALLGRRVHLDLRVRVEADWLARPDRLAALELA
jgi:GTPase